MHSHSGHVARATEVQPKPPLVSSSDWVPWATSDQQRLLRSVVSVQMPAGQPWGTDAFVETWRGEGLLPCPGGALSLSPELGLRRPHPLNRLGTAVCRLDPLGRWLLTPSPSAQQQESRWCKPVCPSHPGGDVRPGALPTACVLGSAAGPPGPFHHLLPGP